MQAYEFFARPENGVIPIPKEFANKITPNVKVIVLEIKPASLDLEGASTGRKSDLLLPPTLDTTRWKFNREEANAR